MSKKEDNKLTDSEIDDIQRPEGVSRQEHRATIRKIEKVREKLVKDEALTGAVFLLMSKGFNKDELDIAYTILKHISANEKIQKPTASK